MTLPSSFYDNTLKTLDYLETILPKGSIVTFIGILDGRILWDNLHDKLHPYGVTYRRVFKYLNCAKVNPCARWLNEDINLREEASKRADELNNQYKRIISERSTHYKNFKMMYQDYPYFSNSSNISEMIEPFGIYFFHKLTF